MQPDHLHPNTVGADARAQLIAEGVRQCLALSPLSGAGVGR
jgi:lysophospholipase L1-like esterase